MAPEVTCILLQQLILLIRLEDNNMTVNLKYFYILGVHMSHYLGLCTSFKGKNDFSNFVSVQQLGTLIGRRRIAMNLGMSIKYHVDACESWAKMRVPPAGACWPEMRIHLIMSPFGVKSYVP